MDHSKNTLVESEKFDDKVHRVGVITTIIMWVFFIGVPLGVTLYFKLKINIVTLITTTVPIAITFALVGLAEKLSMAPIIGPGAIYLASTTGNVQNMKLPAALNAMRIMGVEEGSEKGRVVSIIAVATSAVVTTTIVFLGMLFLAPMITPLLNKPHIKPAFDNMLPALMGPMVLPVVLKNTKSAIVPFTIAIIFALALGSSYGTLQSFVMVGVILISLGVFKLAMKKGISLKKKNKMSKQERVEKLVKLAGNIFKREFQEPKAQKGRYDVVGSRLEKVKWAYRHWHNQLEIAERGSGLEDYFREQDINFQLPKGFEVEKTASISSGGDLLAVDVLTPENTRSIFSDIEDFYGRADLVCANLESPVDVTKPIGRTQVFGQPAQMNTSRSMLERFIKQGGINYFSTANNHSIDWGEKGLLATIDELERAGVYFSGTNRSPEEQEDVEVIDLNGIKIAMLSYTMDLNGREVDKGKEYLVNEVRFNDEVCDISLIERHVARAREKGADKIIACCHWGWEFEMYPHANTVEVGHRIIETGVDIILGNHPHVAQPMEKYTYKKDGKSREGFIVYSFGNFVGYHPKSRNSSLAYTIRFKISKGKIGGKNKSLMHDLEILPIYILNEDLKDGRFNCRILKFKNVLEDQAGKCKYGLTELERENLSHLNKIVLNKILIPRSYDEDLIYK